MTKASMIKDYINKHNPTRKELIKYLAIDLNGLCSEVEFDKRYVRYLNGYYSTNFSKWYNNGNLIRKNNRLYLTPQGKKISLYSLPLEVKYKRAINEVKRLRTRGYELGEKVYEYEKIFKTIKNLSI